MSVTAEEIEIVIKGNIQDALKKIDELKTKINEELLQATKGIEPSIEMASKSISNMTEQISKSSEQLGKMKAEVEEISENMSKKMKASANEAKKAISEIEPEIKKIKTGLKTKEPDIVKSLGNVDVSKLSIKKRKK